MYIKDKQHIKRARPIISHIIRFGMACYLIFLRICNHSISQRINIAKPCVILLTGTFFSDNWIIPHLKPLARSKLVKKVIMVSETPVPKIEKVVEVLPNQILVRFLGGDIARLLTFIYLGMRYKPEYVGGFHILGNGLCALLVAKLIGSRCIYFCGGGPKEVIGGGYDTGHKVFGKIAHPDYVIEKQLLQAISMIDIVTVMGSRASEYFHNRNVRTKIFVNPGGFELKGSSIKDKVPEYDLILVARLTEVKRIDAYLQIIKKLISYRSNIKALVVGGGPLQKKLIDLSIALEIDKHVLFTGHQDNVEEWIGRAKIFVLTSYSEGVSLAMIEAMLCRLPPVVSNVGDLKDLISDGVNGYLVEQGRIDEFCHTLNELLNKPHKAAIMGEMARKTAENYSIKNSTAKWSDLLEHFD